MKLKYLILFVLLVAMLLAVSCGKKPTENTETPENTDPSCETEIVIPKGLNFSPVTEGSFLVLVEGQHYEGEELVIPSASPDGKIVVEVGSFGFWRLTNLKKVSFPATIEKINAEAFEGCTALTEIVFPNSLERIGLSAFEGCTSLSSVTIPSSVCIIGSDAFKDCSALTEITYAGSIEQWNAFATFRSTTWLDPDKTITVHCTDGDLVGVR